MQVDVQVPGRRKALQTVGAVLANSAWAWAWALPLPALAQAPATKVPKGVEFADLMRLLMPAAPLRPLPWLALNAWPVRWRSAAATPLARPQPSMGLMRLGELVLLIDGKPAYRASDRRPGGWSLLARGSENGVAEISLGPQQLAAENGLALSALMSKGFTLEAVCQSQGTQGDSVWRLGLAGRASMHVVETTSQGRGGIGVELRLPYTPAGIQQAVCT